MNEDRKDEGLYTARGRRVAALVMAVMAWCGTGWSGTAPAHAQLPATGAGAEGGADRLFLDRVDVQLVNVEAFVSDRDGNRVTDLGRDDFEVLVDGEKVEVTHFAAGRAAPPRDSRRVPATTETEPAPPEAITEDRALEAPAPAPRPLLLVVHVDNRQIAPGNRKRVLDALGKLIPERVENGDSVMLTTYGQGLDVVQPLTRDEEVLARGLRRIGKMASYRQMEDSALLHALRQQQRDAGASSSGSAGAIASANRDILEGRAQEAAVSAQASAAALGRVLDSLAGLPGRKALLYVSDGLSIGSRGPANEARAPADANPLRFLYDGLGEQANAAEVTVYAFDARGPNPSMIRSAENADILGIGVGTGAPVDAAAFEIRRNADLQTPLLDLAVATGGQAVLNTYNLEGAVQQLAADFSAYYSLGFPAPSSGLGDYHRVEVRVKRPGLKVRHRHGFIAKPTEMRVAERARSYLLQGWESNPLGAELQFAAPKKRDRGWRVPVLVRIPAGSLTLLPQGDRQVGKVHLYVAVRDTDGRQSELTRLSRQVDLPLESAEGGPEDVGYAVQVDLRTGTQDLMVAVWDEVGGTESYLLQRVEVTDPG